MDSARRVQLLSRPGILNHDDRAWPKWLARSEKFLRDANDYWFHVYKPQTGDIIVDIGAGRGEDVFAFSRAVGSKGHVWAIEPHPISYAALVKLCELNKLDNVTTLNLACVDTPASLQIETMPVWESSYVREGAPTPTSHPVQGLRFDVIAAQLKIDRIDFLKMNIEGAERVALPGCADGLQSTRFACVAAHDFRADRGEGDQFRTLAFVRDFLARCGFSPGNSRRGSQVLRSLPRARGPLLTSTCGSVFAAAQRFSCPIFPTLHAITIRVALCADESCIRFNLT